MMRAMATRRERQGLRPVQEIVGRLRYDVGFDAARFSIGYEDRFGGVREAPLLDFLGASEIPWHRITQVKAGALVVWDRKARVDLVFGSGDSPAPDHPAILRACAPEAPRAPEQVRPGPRAPRQGAFDERACFGFEPGQGWAPVAATRLAEVEVEALAVATFNVLMDLHEPEKIYTERRIEACVALLRGCEADVIALQEVTPRLWATLLAEPWLRERYFVCPGPDAEDLAPYGQAILSRWPLATELHAFSSKKRVLVGRMSLGGRPTLIAAVHLTSNYKGEADERRAEQLSVLFERVGRADVADAILLGDFNFGDDDENEQLGAAGLVDAWTTVHPHHPGFTFDPQRNPLAAIMSRTGRAARFDRVLLRSPAGSLAPVDVTVLGDKPIGTGPDGQEMYASDHFGLCALLQVTTQPLTVDAAPVHTSALAVIPPEAVWRPIQAIREAHDPAFPRWMPHVNLVYGFVPEGQFERAVEALAPLLRGRTSFTVRLDGLRRFDHRGSTTVWLEPKTDPPGALTALQAAIAPCFPRCDEQGSRSAAGFTPHLTVAKLSGSEAEIAGKIEAWKRTLTPLEFTVDAVHLIARAGEAPFSIKATVGIGAPSASLARPPAWSVLPTPRHAAAARAIAEACAAELGAKGPCVHLVGSARLGVAGAESDLDLAAIGPEAHDRMALFEGVCARLAGRGALRARPATGAGLPVLRGMFDGIAFDLQSIAAPPSMVALDPGAWTADHLGRLDEPSRRAALGFVDADRLATTCGVPPEVLRDLLKSIRRWAAARQIEGGAWGLLGGYTWALLAAFVTRGAEDRSARPWPLLRRFFAELAAWPVGKPIAFGAIPPGQTTRRTQWPIYTLTPPAFNSARSLTSATLAVIVAELRRGQAILQGAVDEAAGMAALCEPIDPAAQRHALVLDLRAPAEEEGQAIGCLEGHVVGLLLALEESGARVRPFPRPDRDGAARRWTIGLEGGEPAKLLAAARATLAEFTGAGQGWPAEATLTATLRR